MRQYFQTLISDSVNKKYFSELAGVEEQMDGKLCSSGEGGQKVRICLYVYVFVALPMIVGVWSTTVMLWHISEREAH